MVADVTADFFGLMNETLFVYAAAALIVSFLLWEVPRSLRLFSEESIKNLYSDSSRLVNIGLFLFGLLIIGYMFMFENIPKIIKLLKIRGITSAVMIVVVVACFAAVFRFVQNTLKRTEGNSMGNFHSCF